MSKFIKLTPFLLAVFPVVFLYDQNKNEITSQVLWLPVLYALLLASVLFFVFRFFEKDLKKKILISSLVVIGFLYYGFIYDAFYNFKFGDFVLGRHKYLFPLWIIIISGGLYWIKKTKKNLDNFLGATCFAALVLVLMPSLTSIQYNLTKPDLKNDKIVEYNLQDGQKLKLPQPLPDIYYIVPDAYAGPKILNKYFNFENKEFHEHLKKKGFAIAANSRSSYPNTYFSLSSTLNMEHINYLGDLLGKDSADYKPVRQMINDNKVLRQLGVAGYKYLHYDSDYTTFLEGDPLASETPLDIFVRILMKSTILRPFGGRYGFKESAINSHLRTNVLKTFDSLDQSVNEEGPKFVFAHITSPHGPYIFDQNGEIVNRQIGNNIEEMEFYLDQLMFVNKRLTVLVDNILANSKTPPIIIIQSDHGFYVPPEILGDTNYETLRFNPRMVNLSAYYLPRKCGPISSKSFNNINTVNTFRFIFDKCFGTNYGLLENKSFYFLSESRPYDLLELDYSKDSF